MRLICPNCSAQYEVPADVMPVEGREVQCSNCGYTWFQTHPDAPNDDAPKQEDGEEVVTASNQDTISEAEHSASGDEMNASTADKSAVTEDKESEVLVEGDAPTAPLPPRRELDPAVANVLRAEADLEEQARRNEAIGFESQPELGLPENTSNDAEHRAQQTRNRMSRMRGEAVAETTAPTSAPSVAAAHSASRRDLLPDIEEINSTLRSNSDRSPATDPGQTAQLEAREHRSSRRGFAVAVMLVAVFVLIYAFANEIGEAVPETQQPLAAYVSAVDTGREWLDARVLQLLGLLDQAAQSATSE